METLTIQMSASSAKVANGNTSVFHQFRNYNEVIFFINVTAFTTGPLQVFFDQYDPLSGVYFLGAAQSVSITATGMYQITMSSLIGLSGRVRWTVGAGSVTFSISACLKRFN